MDFNIIREIIHDDVDRSLKHHQHSVPKTQKSDQPINWLGRRTGVFLDIDGKNKAIAQRGRMKQHQVSRLINTGTTTNIWKWKDDVNSEQKGSWDFQLVCVYLCLCPNWAAAAAAQWRQHSANQKCRNQQLTSRLLLLSHVLELMHLWKCGFSVRPGENKL